MHYKWNQIDPQSAGILKFLITMLCFTLFMYYWHSHPKLAFISGVCVGVLLGWAIPPRSSLRQLAIAVFAALVLGTALTMLQH